MQSCERPDLKREIIFDSKWKHKETQQSSTQDILLLNVISKYLNIPSVIHEIFKGIENKVLTLVHTGLQRSILVLKSFSFFAILFHCKKKKSFLFSTFSSGCLIIAFNCVYLFCFVLFLSQGSGRYGCFPPLYYNTFPYPTALLADTVSHF